MLKAEQERLADLLAVAASVRTGGKEGERMSAERFYALLLRAYPERFRVRFEAGMRDAFRRDHAAARDRGLAVLGALLGADCRSGSVVWPRRTARVGRSWAVFADSPATGAGRAARPGSPWTGAMRGAR